MPIMLADEANLQKQKIREEQIRKWREHWDNYKPTSRPVRSGATTEKSVKFPQGCVYLAACSANDIDEVKLYLKMGVNINTTNIDGLTALHQACIDDNFEMVKFLVENNADLNPQDNEGWTPLHAAVSVGNMAVAKYLIAKGARLNICNNDSDLPIDLCEEGSGDAMRTFLGDEMKRQNIDADTEKKREEMVMLQDAVENTFRDRVHPKTGATPMHVSAAKGYTRVMRLLIAAGANLNATDKDGWTPLHAAAHWEQDEACKILAEAGADFDTKTYSGQTVFDVCDDEMATKMRTLQAKYRNNNNNNMMRENSIELTALNTSTSSTSSNTSSSSSVSSNSVTRRDTDLTNKQSKRSKDYDDQRSSIVRSSNEAKSIISDKERKQEKVMLSPTLSNEYLNGSDNSDNEKNSNKKESSIQSKDKNYFQFDKENINSKSKTTNSSSGSISNNRDNEDYPLRPSSKSARNRNIALQESLRSLSAQVKQNMDEDKDDTNQERASIEPATTSLVSSTSASISSMQTGSTSSVSASSAPGVDDVTANAKCEPAASSTLVSSTNTSNSSTATSQSQRPTFEKRWGSTSNANEATPYKRRLATSSLSGDQQPRPSSSAQAPATTPTSLSKTSSIGHPDTTTSTNGISADDTIPASPSVVAQSSACDMQQRRYSSFAPKEEQAELIRKQKAKMERHYRRSTQAVSYEDIKSAEATIKASNTPTLLPQVSVQSVDSPPPLPPQPPPSLPPSSPLSSLSSVSSSAAAATSTPVSVPSSPYSLVTKSEAQSASTATSSLGASNASVENNAEKDTIIAKDIETDKLLNIIEKSKGFSDSYSTRRNRNRSYLINNPLTSYDRDMLANSLSKTNGVSSNNHNYNNTNNENESSSANNSTNSTANSLSLQQQKKKKMIWNQETMEVELKDEDQHQINQKNNLFSPHANSNNTNSHQPALKRQLSERTASHSQMATQLTSQTSAGNLQTGVQRPTSRFSAYESSSQLNGNTANNSSTNNMTNGRSNNVKRSFSQVPSTDRVGYQRNSTTTLSSTTNTVNVMPSGSHHNELRSTVSNPVAAPVTFSLGPSKADNRLSANEDKNSIESVQKENDQLKQALVSLKKDFDEQIKTLQEKRSYDRRISELEEELKKMESVKQDNIRLKEENAALIRVISKLSK